MKWCFRLALVVLVLIVAAAAAIFFTGGLRAVIAWIGKPRHGWDLALKAPAPDFAKEDAWAALPTKPNGTDLLPDGVGAPATNSQVDVFFVHPTGYLRGADWNSPLDPDSQTEENTKWMMANQASVFNGCCAIYAPRYREASIFRYFAATPEIFELAGEFAYADVDRAFTHFLQHYSKGRPFILASHSQGTEHAMHLIERRIDGAPIAQRMVAAYLIGGAITDKDVAALRTIRACASATDLHCIIHWATYGEGGKPVRESVDKLLCTNPLTWQRDGALAPASLHKGAVPRTGEYALQFWGKDIAAGVKFGPLKAPMKQWTPAECRGGFLYIADQKDNPFGRVDIMGGKNYHGLDYPMFAIDIRENAKMRVAIYLSGQALSRK